MTRARNNGECCGMCSSFTTRDYPEQAAVGMGRCTAYDQPGKAESFVPADSRSTILFAWAPREQLAARRAFIQKHTKEEA